MTGLAIASTAMLSALGWYVSPRVARARETRRLRRLCATTRSLVLTYDDGPARSLTPRLLELLGERRACATFFVSGSRALEAPDLVAQLIAEGHEVGCHGHDHLNAWNTWPWRAIDDMNRGYGSLGSWMTPSGLYRPPYGKMTAMTAGAVRRRRATVGWWTIKSGDTQVQLPDCALAVRRARAQRGGVVLLHDCDRDSQRNEFVLKSTAQLLDAAEAEGWTARTLSDLLTLAHDPA